MKIKYFEIKNFKCLGPNTIKIDFSENILVLIGENNVGKSSILKALDIFFKNTKKIPQEYYLNHLYDADNAIEITITFHELSDKDKEHQAVKTFTNSENGELVWKLKKQYYYDTNGNHICKYFAITSEGSKENPGGRNTNTDDLFFDDKMQVIFVEAVKDVLETVKTSGRSISIFQQIFNLLIKEELYQKDEYKALKKALIEYENLFTGSTKISKIAELEKNISLKISRIITSKSLINTNPPTEDAILPIPQLSINDGRIVDVNPDHQGHGLQRTIIFSLLELLGENKSPVTKEIGPKNLILIEEPEIYMHPQMERKIADTLYDIAASGKAQVICTTHSPIFIRLDNKHKSLVRLERESNNDLKVIQREEIFSVTDRENKRNKLRMITNFDPAVNEIFFARRVVLVEGDTEVAIFREAAELLNLFITEENKHKKRDTTFVNCRGKWTINLFQEVLNHFGIKYVVIHDKDNEELNEGANGKILELLNNDESRRKLFESKIEDVLNITDTSKEKPIKALEAIHILNAAGTLETKIGGFIKFAYDIR